MQPLSHSRFQIKSLSQGINKIPLTRVQIKRKHQNKFIVQITTISLTPPSLTKNKHPNYFNFLIFSPINPIILFYFYFYCLLICMVKGGEMKTNTINPSARNHKNFTKSYKNGVPPILLWFLGLTSCFSLFLLYSTNPFHFSSQQHIQQQQQKEERQFPPITTRPHPIKQQSGNFSKLYIIYILHPFLFVLVHVFNLVQFHV